MDNKCGNSDCTKSSPDPDSLQWCSRCRKTAYCSRECQSAAWSSHKGACFRPNYIIKFHLSPGHITNPPVTRTLSCPAHAVFYMLHLALQTAFGWATTHSFDIAVLDPNYREPANAVEALTRHSIAMSQQVSPSDPREYTFRVVDPVEHTMFSGIDRAHEPTRRHPNTLEKKADKYKLFQLLDDAQFQNHQIVYTYDFGDNWEHHFTVLGRADSTDNFICLDGSGHYVAEDSRGVSGWEDLKAAYQTQNPTKEQRQRRQWFERQASNPDPKGLAGDRVEAWDRDKINRELETDTMLRRFQARGPSTLRDEASLIVQSRR